MRLLRYLLLLTSILLPAMAQEVTRGGFSSRLIAYLELSTEQALALNRVNSAFLTFRAERDHRSTQLQREIDLEMQKPVMDPRQIGLRYRDLELIRREVAAELEQTYARSRAVLTAAQKEKLALLEQSLRLRETACDAVYQNLFAMPAPVPSQPSFVELLFGSANGAASPCPAGFPAGIIPAGRLF